MSRTKDPSGLYKRGKYWYFDIYKTPTHRVRRSTKCTSFLDALKIKEEFISISNVSINNRQELNGGCFFNDVVAKFLEDKKRVLKERTIKDYKYLFKILSSYFINRDLNQIKKIDLKNYENLRKMNGVSDSWLRKEMGTLQALFNYAIEYELISNNPFVSYNFRTHLKNMKLGIDF